MAESGHPAPTPPPDEMHWGLFLHAELKEVKQDVRDLRRELGEVRKETAQHFAQVRQEMAQLRAEIRQDLRHNLIVMIGFCSILAAIVVAVVEYRIPGG